MRVFHFRHLCALLVFVRRYSFRRRIAELPIWDPHDLVPPRDYVQDLDFETTRKPGLYLLKGEVINKASPSGLFLLFFRAQLVAKIAQLTNKKGKMESEKVRLHKLG